MSIGRSELALVARSKFREVTVVIALPTSTAYQHAYPGHSRSKFAFRANVHLVVKHLGFAGFGLGDQALVENIENILTDALQFVLDLLAIFADDADVLVGSLGLFLVFDGRNDAPRSTASANDVLVRDREEITLVNGKFASNLGCISIRYFLNASRKNLRWQPPK